MLATLRLNWFILRTSINERLMYRGDFAFATLMRFLPIVTQIFLWSAIYGVYSGNRQGNLNGYSYENMISYYLLAMVGRAFSSMPGLSSGIAREIRDGTVKKYLTQPIDMLEYLFWARVAHKLVYYAVATGPFILVFFLCRSFFTEPLDAWTVLGFCLSLFMSFLIGFLLEALLGLIAFWILEVSSLIFIFMMLNYFLSGHMIPLDWVANWLHESLPAWLSWLGDVVLYSPFQYLAYFPAAVMLNRYTHAELARHLVLELGWVLLLYVACRWTFKQGVRRYGAFGG